MQGQRPRRPKPTRKTLSALNAAIKLFGGDNKDLADAIGVSKTLVGNWRTAKYAMSLSCAILIERESEGYIKATDLIPEL